MKRLLLWLSILAAPVSAQVILPDGSWAMATPDRAITATLDGLNDTATMSLAGREGAGFQLITANLSATVKPQVSFDNGTTWTDSQFVTVAGVLSANIVFSGGSSTQQRSIVVAGGVSHVRVIVSAFTSGTSTAIVRNTAASSFLLSVGTTSVTQGTSPWVISGTVTANAGTNLNTSLLALEAGGNLAAAATSLAIIDDWDETDRAKVNPIVGQAGIAGNAGATSATTTRVVLVNDQATATVPLLVRPTDGSAAKTPFDLDLDTSGATASRQSMGLGLATPVGAVPLTGQAFSGPINAASVYVEGFSSTVANGTPVRAEDAPFGATEPVMVAGVVRADSPGTDTGSDGDVAPAKGDAAGRLWTNPHGPVSTAVNDGSCATVNGTASTVISSSSTRRGFVLKAAPTNTANIFVKMGTTATTADFPLEPGAGFNMLGPLVYTGDVSAITALASLSLCVVVW